MQLCVRSESTNDNLIFSEQLVLESVAFYMESTEEFSAAT